MGLQRFGVKNEGEITKNLGQKENGCFFWKIRKFLSENNRYDLLFRYAGKNGKNIGNSSIETIIVIMMSGTPALV